jgi:hypothetical protein
LPICKDQFCQNCFELYIKEIVKNSWGYKTSTILCPVCSIPLEDEDWEDWVDPEIVDDFHSLNVPFKRLVFLYFTRCVHAIVKTKYMQITNPQATLASTKSILY